MAKPVALFFSDSHLQDRAWSDKPIEGDAYYSLAQIADFAIDKGLQAVVGAGDLIDRQLNRSTPIVRMNEQMDRLAKAEIPTYFIEGQHELENVPWLTSHPHPQSIDGLQVKIGDFNVFGLNFHPADLLGIALANIPKGTDILVCHQVWGEFMGSIANPQGGFGDIPSVNTVVTGDYHVYKTVRCTGKDGQELYVLSPGSTCMQSIDEPSEKFFVILMDDGKFMKVRLKTRPMLDWEQITRPDQVDRFISLIDEELAKLSDATVGYPEGIRKPLLRVTFSREVPDAYRRIKAAVNGRAHLFPKELIPERPEVAERRATTKAAGLRRGTTMETLLPTYLAQQSMKFLEPTAVRLLEAEDVAGELRRLREEALQ